MQYSPKLKKVMAEVNAVLEKHNVGGLIVLHEPGMGEFKLKIDTSYSCAFFEGDTLRIRTDLGWSKEEKKQKVTDTYNLFDVIKDLATLAAENCGRATALIETKYKRVDDDPGTFTTHTQQNN